MSEKQHINILYYSNKCDTCKNLLKVLEADNILDQYKQICVDVFLQKKSIHMLPHQIKKVPTIVIGSLGKLFEGEDTFKWINTLRALKKKSVDSQQPDKKNPIGYVKTEMSEFSDRFAYLNVDMPMPHTFFDVGAEEKNAIYTAPEQKKINKREQSKLLTDFNKQREIQLKENTDVYKKQILDKMYYDEVKKILDK
jgi:hypothetical protein